MSEQKLKIGITQGDTNGIGWEVILKALADPRMTELFTPVVYGSPKAAAYYRNTLAQTEPVQFNAVTSARDARRGKVNLVACGDTEQIEPGKASAEAGRAAVEALAGALPRGTESSAAAFPPIETTHDVRVAHPGAVQSSLRIGRLLFPRQHPDFVGMQVVATALGGYFGSRLMQNLREEHGYTYGVVSAMVNFEREGYFAVATQVGTDVTRPALEACYAEIERLRTEPMPEEELALVKNMMAGEMMRILDGPFGIADVTIENILCGTDNGIIDENLRRIRAMTPADVQRLARKYLAREELVTVVAGDL